MMKCFGQNNTKSTRSVITNKYTGNENIIYKNDQGIPLKHF